MKIILLAWLSILLCNAATCLPAPAAPVEKYFLWPIRGNEQANDELIAGILEASCHPTPDCDVDGPLTNTEIGRIRAMSRCNLWVHKGAPRTFLKDRTLFHKLELVGLRSEFNDENLQALALNYPEVESVSIGQTTPLSDAAVRSLRRFNNLKFLALECPVHDPRLLLDALPQSIRHLQVYDSWRLPPLPDLYRLDVHNCRIDQSYLAHLNAPNLQELSFARVDLAKGSLKDLRTFKKIHCFSSYNAHIDDSELTNFRYTELFGLVPCTLPSDKSLLRHIGSNAFLEVSIQSDWCAVDQLAAQAMRLSKQANWEEALKSYDESVFSKPSVHGYLQRARCLGRLHQFDRALNSCDDAASMGGCSAEVDAVRKEILNLQRLSN